MGMQDYEINLLMRDYSYFQDNRFNIQSVFKNEDSNVLCVILDLKTRDLKDLVNNFGWKCIFDENVKDDQELSICITK